MILVLVLLLLWGIIAIITFYNDIKNKFNYWYSALIFSISLGLLCEIVRYYIVPITINKEISELIARVLSALSYRLSPYFAILAGLEMYYQNKKKRKINIVLFLPIILGFIFDFIYPEASFITIFPDYSPFFWTIVVWAVPYGLISYTLMILSFLKEKSQWFKQQKLLTCFLMIPIMFLMTSAYLLPLLIHTHRFIYNLLSDIMICLLIVMFALKYGILGIRVKFERTRLSSTMKAMNSGTAILNHSIKNEIFKISMCMKNIRNLIHKTKVDINDVDENIQTILDATDHLTAMMRRIQDQMKEIILLESTVDLAELVNKAIEMQGYYLENVTVVKNYNQGFIVKCDQIHITEVLNNIIKNAVEAMLENGRLELSIYSKRTEVVIEVKDNGIGISKENVKYVFDPFFSTKRPTMNFGLGMSYSYNVMQQHQGNLEIQSKENVGTIVSLIFPKERILAVARV